MGNLTSKPALGSLVIGSDKEVTGSFSDTVYLFVYSNMFLKKGEWLRIASIEPYTETRFKELNSYRTSKFDLIEWGEVKYISFHEFGIQYPPEVRILHVKEPDNSARTRMFELLKGDVLYLDECGSVVLSWSVDEDQLLTVNGMFDEAMTSCLDYSVEASIISIPDTAEKIAGYQVNDQQVFYVRTFTDIGGHFLNVKRDNVIIERIHLRNGFGDGSYRLKFINGVLFR